jgi:hypothetical protein
MAHAMAGDSGFYRGWGRVVMSACAEALALGFATELFVLWVSLWLSMFCDSPRVIRDSLGHVAVCIHLPGALLAELMEPGSGIPYWVLTFILQTVFWSMVWLVVLQWRAALTRWRLWRTSRRRGLPLDDVN